MQFSSKKILKFLFKKDDNFQVNSGHEDKSHNLRGNNFMELLKLFIAVILVQAKIYVYL